MQINVNNRAFNILQIANRWLQLRLEILVCVPQTETALMCSRRTKFGFSMNQLCFAAHVSASPACAFVGLFTHIVGLSQ
jgi:diaminopimelate decarboxylase